MSIICASAECAAHHPVCGGGHLIFLFFSYYFVYLFHLSQKKTNKQGKQIDNLLKVLLIILIVGAVIIAAAGLGMWLHKRFKVFSQPFQLSLCLFCLSVSAFPVM